MGCFGMHGYKSVEANRRCKTIHFTRATSKGDIYFFFL